MYTKSWYTTPLHSAPPLQRTRCYSTFSQHQFHRGVPWAKFYPRKIALKAISDDSKLLSLASFDQELDSALYLVSTPIGNLGDITLRAISTLRSVSCIFAEDTRRTQQLLNVFGIHTRLLSCHAHNEHQRITQILQKLQRNEAIALVSDAGTPTVSDPGRKIITAVVNGNFRVVPVPGASAVLASVISTGFTSSTFTFIGFLPSKRSDRRRKLADFVDLSTTLVVYVAPSDLSSVLVDCMEILGETRQCCVAREVTKLHEEFHRGNLESCSVEFANRRDLKGEITLVIEGRVRDLDTFANSIPDHIVCSNLQYRFQQGDSLSQAARNVGTELGIKKQRAYSLGLKLKQQIIISEIDNNNN